MSTLDDKIEELGSYGYFSTDSNLTTDELKSNVSARMSEDADSAGLFLSLGDAVASADKFYFFLPRMPGAVEAPITYSESLRIALDKNKYGFNPNRTVKINPIDDLREVKLSKDARNKLNELLALKEVGLNYLLESVGFIANDSIEYDFTGIEELRQNSDYVPSGNEAVRGDCALAGNYIRLILHALGIEDNMRFNAVVSENGIAHDTTLVFDKQTGDWAVINSKSPNKRYNLVPKEKLVELGKPYHTK